MSFYFSRSSRALAEPIWAHMRPYGPLWAHMGPKNPKGYINRLYKCLEGALHPALSYSLKYLGAQLPIEAIATLPRPNIEANIKQRANKSKTNPYRQTTFLLLKFQGLRLLDVY